MLEGETKGKLVGVEEGGGEDEDMEVVDIGIEVVVGTLRFKILSFRTLSARKLLPGKVFRGKLLSGYLCAEVISWVKSG